MSDTKPSLTRAELCEKIQDHLLQGMFELEGQGILVMVIGAEANNLDSVAAFVTTVEATPEQYASYLEETASAVRTGTPIAHGAEEPDDPEDNDTVPGDPK